MRSPANFWCRTLIVQYCVQTRPFDSIYHALAEPPSQSHNRQRDWELEATRPAQIPPPTIGDGIQVLTNVRTLLEELGARSHEFGGGGDGRVALDKRRSVHQPVHRRFQSRRGRKEGTNVAGKGPGASLAARSPNCPRKKVRPVFRAPKAHPNHSVGPSGRAPDGRTFTPEIGFRKPFAIIYFFGWG